MKYSAYIIVGVVGVALGAAGMRYFSPEEQLSTTNVVRLKDPGTFGTTAASVGGVLYTNNQYHFTLRYPEGLVLKEFDEGADSWTAVFQAPGEKVGFQIYITPHASDTISGEVIRRDVPSGKIEDLQEEYLRPDLLVATFWSEAPLTGRNREIWFIHGGYLYEFTAYAPAEGMLREVLQTLMFTD